MGKGRDSRNAKQKSVQLDLNLLEHYEVRVEHRRLETVDPDVETEEEGGRPSGGR
jgi:hypothetical protein